MKQETYKHGDNAYYCNEPCWISADLGDEAVINMPIGEEGDGRTLVISKKHLSRERVDVGEKFRTIIQKAEAAKDKLEQEAYKTLADGTAKIKEIRERAKKYEGLEPMLDFLDGKIKYILTEDYGSVFELIEADKALCQANSNYEKHLAAILYRSSRDKVNEFGLYLGDYSDYSGGSKKCKAFKTLEEVVSYVCAQLSIAKAENISWHTLATCDKLNIKHPKLEEARARINNQEMKSIKDHIVSEQKSLEIYKNKLKQLENTKIIVDSD